MILASQADKRSHQTPETLGAAVFASINQLKVQKERNETNDIVLQLIGLYEWVPGR